MTDLILDQPERYAFIEIVKNYAGTAGATSEKPDDCVPFFSEDNAVSCEAPLLAAILSS